MHGLPLLGHRQQKLDWFETINIAGVPLSDQELLNAIYSGPFVTAAKAEFSNSQNANIQKWSAYIKGSANRQEFLERALDWVSKGSENIGGYMSAHRGDRNINELKRYFDSVIDWVSTVFVDVLPEMRGLEWGRLYEEYHNKSYKPKKMSEEVMRLIADDCVTSNKGIFEFLLGGSVDTKLLDVRVFDKKVARAAYQKQTNEAEPKGKSNCPLCAVGNNANKSRIYKFEEMDADHVAAWSKGGGSVGGVGGTARCCARRTIGPKGIDKISRVIGLCGPSSRARWCPSAANPFSAPARPCVTSPRSWRSRFRASKGRKRHARRAATILANLAKRDGGCAIQARLVMESGQTMAGAHLLARAVVMMAMGLSMLVTGCAGSGGKEHAAGGSPFGGGTAEGGLPGVGALPGVAAESGLEVHTWVVADDAARIEAAMVLLAEPAPLDESSKRALESNGFRLWRTAQQDLDALREAMGGSNLNEEWWHGQVLDWRELHSRGLAQGARGVAVDGRVRAFPGGGAFQLHMRAWIVPMEDGPRLELELTPSFIDGESLNDNRRRAVAGRPSEVFGALLARASLEAGYAYVLTCEAPSVEWSRADDESQGGEEGEGRSSLPSAFGPDAGGGGVGPDAAGPLTVGEAMLHGDMGYRVRGVIICIARLPKSLFPAELLEPQAAEEERGAGASRGDAL